TRGPCAPAPGSRRRSRPGRATTRSPSLPARIPRGSEGKATAGEWWRVRRDANVYLVNDFTNLGRGEQAGKLCEIGRGELLGPRGRAKPCLHEIVCRASCVVSGYDVRLT